MDSASSHQCWPFEYEMLDGMVDVVVGEIDPPLDGSGDDQFEFEFALDLMLDGLETF